MSGPKLGIDFSVMCHLSWHSMASPSYEGRTDIEIDEFSRNLTSRIYALHERFKPSQMDFLMDGPVYWRKAIYPKYYKEHGKVWVEVRQLDFVETIENGKKVVYKPTETVHYIMHDLKYYLVKHYKEFDAYKATKLKKAEIEELLLSIETEENIQPLAYDKTPQGIIDLFPAYKGNRKDSKWPYETTRKEFKDLMNSIALSLAKTFSARVVMSKEAEADDLAYVYHEDNPGSDLILVTTDSDWHQLLRKGLYLKFFNPMKNEFVECAPEKSAADLALKIMTGDSSDNIPGISLIGDKKTLGPKAAEKIIMVQGMTNIYKHLGEFAVPHALARNYELIGLYNCPKKIQKDIRIQFTKSNANKSRAVSIESYGLTDEDCLSIRSNAKEMRDLDMTQGLYAT